MTTLRGYLASAGVLVLSLDSIAGTEAEQLGIACVESAYAVGAAQDLRITNISKEELGYYVTIEMMVSGTWKEMAFSIDPDKVEPEADLVALKPGEEHRVLFRSEKVRAIGALRPGSYRFKVFAFNGFQETISYSTVFSVK